MRCAEVASSTAWQWWTRNASASEGEVSKESIRTLLSVHVDALRTELGDERYQSEGFGDARSVLRRSVGDKERELGVGARAYAKMDVARN